MRSVFEASYCVGHFSDRVLSCCLDIIVGLNTERRKVIEAVWEKRKARVIHNAEEAEDRTKDGKMAAGEVLL